MAQSKTTMQLIVPSSANLRTDPPALPDDVKQRFPSLAEWEKSFRQWWEDVSKALQRQEADAAADVTRKINAISP